ncbi:hypothetical protein NEOLI_003343 [Neolecta irregularis DAH-3]|uniref:DUF7492 domain-containing protein n=1 Tax=Neolecta irregularis (strain DAH-3) TaxID=1198029 RepID=A0A1U7LPM6_NEOID|nr:hypothetical protein NEOLI_003343 [Neolecta irregularis DAH-3]|eukprot:OLL24589.1 hypothetical protein NEOLI_003343 [Neolecta irregularis DAH-3]
MHPAVLISLVLNIFCQVCAHSWIDKLETQRGNVGYIRAYIGRSSTTNIDEAETYALPDASSYSRSSCMASQQSATYSSEYPMLSAYPGDTITATYKENGHVCIEPTRQTAPNATYAGNYQWIWTGNSKQSLNTLGQLLSTSGRTLGSHSFDDGKCCENADNSIGRTRQDCNGSFTLPAGTPPGEYPIYWIWKFVKFGGATETYYTSCFDVQVLEETPSKVESIVTPTHYVTPQPAAASVSATYPGIILTIETVATGPGKIPENLVVKNNLHYQDATSSCSWVCQPIGKRDL